MDEKDRSHVRIVAKMDQLASQHAEMLVPALATFYRALLDEGFSDQSATALTQTYLSCALGRDK